GLAISYPPPALHVAQPRTPRPGVDLVAAFDALLTATVARRAVSAPPGQVGVELSGGADSTNVALAVIAIRGDRVSSYGLLVRGDTGQQRRRVEIVRALGLHDVPIASVEYPPFAPDGPRALPHDPTGSYYLEAFEAARQTGSNAGMRVVFTGVGGDELMALRLVEREAGASTADEPELPSWLGPRAVSALGEVEEQVAPASPVHPPSLMAFAARNPPFLRWGMWPVSPLADPLVVRFGESLPVAWRRGKTLLRKRLRRAGLAEETADPPQPETFTGLMQAGLGRYGLPLLAGLVADSLLVDAGYVNRTALATACDQARSAAVIPSLLYDTIALEVGLRSLI
ncbi:MAG: asparagine synthase-related protein, partial [Egibacteraceae bacterium]